MTTIDESAYWYTPIDVSDLLDVPLRVVYDLIERNELGKQVGRAVMISRPEVERLRTRLNLPG